MSNTSLQSLLQSHRILTVNESKEILSQYGFPFNKSVFVSNEQDISQACQNLSFPLVMKIVSPQIVHKTDVGGVILHLNSVQEVSSAFSSLMTSLHQKFPDYELQGVVLEEEVPEGIELIAGVVNDPSFGHCLMFGLGGIFVELIQDISFRLIPASQQDIESMLDEIKFSKILDGIRGITVNRTQLINVLTKLSAFTFEQQDNIAEIDLNPVIATMNKIVIVDARIVLKK